MRHCGPVFLVGPTGVGKTEAAVWLAERLGAEIVSADSMQVYRGLDIGTAKPSAEQRARVPHHCVDVLDVTDPCDAARYRRLALAAIAEIGARGRLPLVVGGSGLYIRSLTKGLFEGPGADPDLRRRLEIEAAEHGPEALHRRLAAVDPEAASRIAVHDLRRIVRALEVQARTGEPVSSLRQQWGAPERGVPLFGLTMERKALYERLDRRVEAMFAAGLVEETGRLREMGLERNPTARDAIGYREVLAHLRGEWTLEETMALVKQNTRRYAKRQLTWFRRESTILWWDVTWPAPEPVWNEVLNAILDQTQGQRAG